MEKNIQGCLNWGKVERLPPNSTLELNWEGFRTIAWKRKQLARNRRSAKRKNRRDRFDGIGWCFDDFDDFDDLDLEDFDFRLFDIDFYK
mmetsp:Transcript_41782/g.48251  ORF Transcript_41782/g.48251 Transcript_41782/m.48251 type:complete len:89 (-) Transcript_41782:134-400(-)